MSLEESTSIEHATTGRPLRFLWWNLQNHAHFDPSRVDRRRPLSLEQYEAKCRQLERAFGTIQQSTGPIDIIALGEITARAAEDLRQRVFPSHRLASLDPFPNHGDLHLAFIFPTQAEFYEVAPFAPIRVPSTTRPMAVLDFIHSGHQIRFIAAHWPPRFQDGIAHHSLAEQLRAYVYRYLEEEAGPRRHVVLMGDFNCEPFDSVSSHFYATRSRSRSRARPHHTDKAMERVRLYNCAWRLLGEQVPHSAHSTAPSVAGSYYWRSQSEWLTVDQILVSGSLLGAEQPCLREDLLRIFAHESLLDEEGHPAGFEFRDSTPSGFSDHLPLVGTITVNSLPEDI